MNSSLGENYSNNSWLTLFCFLLLLRTIPAEGQQLVWAHSGTGFQPHITIVRDSGVPVLVVVGSPFTSKAYALDPGDGHQLWESDLGGPMTRPGSLVADVVLAATHTGRLLALETGTGELLWQTRTERASDFVAGSPTFIDGSIYTITQKGVLSRFSVLGDRIAERTIEPLVNGRRVELVPLWRDANAISYLDQAGRLRTYELETLRPLAETLIPSAPGPGLDDSSSEILAGVYSAPREIVWTTELSGRLRATSAETGQSLWSKRIGRLEDFWSTEGRLLAVPILSALSAGENQRVLLVTRHEALVFDSDNGRELERHSLESAAIGPPLFDLKRRTWWIVTEESLIELDWQGQTRTVPLPILEVPFSASVAGDLLVLATSRGRVYGLNLSSAPILDSPEILQPESTQEQNFEEIITQGI